MIDIGFLGLGQMGAAIAERLEGPQVRLHLHDPAAANIAPFAVRGACAYATCREVADAAAIVFACLPSAAISLHVAAEIAGARAMTHYVEMSTIGRSAMEQIAAGCEANAVTLVDAPVSGGPDAARCGRLAVMAACDDAVLARVKPYLAQIGGPVFHVGRRPGHGQAMKLVNNLIAAATIAVTSEAVVAGAASGLDPDTMVAVLNASSGGSGVTSLLLPNHVLNGRFDFGATIGTMLKDVELGLAEAASSGLPMSANRAAAELWRASAQQVGPNEDLTKFVLGLEAIAQVRLRSAGARLDGGR